MIQIEFEILDFSFFNDSYEDIRMKFGSKNVLLGNIIPNHKKDEIRFLDK